MPSYSTTHTPASIRVLLSSLLLAIFPVVSMAAPNGPRESGLPTVRIYDQRAHRGGPQNFDVAQDAGGVLYFGNLGGVLTFDGAWWRLLKLPNDSSADQIEIGPTGQIAVGSVGEIGFLEPDASQTLQYRSIVPQLPEAYREFEEVRAICAAGDGFAFLTTHFLFFSNGGAPRLLQAYPDGAYVPSRCATIEGKTWLFGKRGLQRLDLNATPAVGPFVEPFREKPVRFVVDGSNDVLTVGVRDVGIFAFDGTNAKPIAPAVGTWMKDKLLTAACRLADGRLVIASARDGFVIVRPDGSIEQSIDQSAGVPEFILNHAFTDREGALWLTFDGPIARVDVSSPVTVLDSRRGVKGSALAVGRAGERLFLGTTHGLYSVKEGANAGTGATPVVDSAPMSAWAMLETSDGLLVGTSDGLFVVSDGARPRRVAGTERVVIYNLKAAKRDPAIVWAATTAGTAVLRRSANGWTYAGPIAGTRLYISTIVEQGDTLWCGSVYDGVVMIQHPMSAKPVVKSFRRGEEISAFEIGGRPVFVLPTSVIHSFDSKGALVPDPVFGKISARGGFFLLDDDAAGNLWVNSIPPRIFERRSDGSYPAEGRPLEQVDASDIQYLAVDDEGIVWFGGERGVFRYEPAAAADTRAQPAPVIRRVVSGNDQLLFGGASVSAEIAKPIDYSVRRLRVEFAPVSYRPGIEYQYQLEPSDDWSPWTDEPFVDYTNLSEGKYRLKVRTRGATGVSREAFLMFEVLPPWYRAPWAAILWILLVAIAVGLVVMLRTRALRRDAENLRVKVAERTDELRRTVEQLSQTQDELVRNNALLEAANDQLEQLSLVDDLTGVANRRAFQRAFDAEWHRAMRRADPVALILIDFDHFKALNDVRGHQAGDTSLKDIGMFMASQVRRAGDVVARIGGEEFAILLPRTTAQEARRVADMLRMGIEKLAIPLGAENESSLLTVSCGVSAVVPEQSLTTNELVERADRALYSAKRNGRNRVCVSEEGTVVCD